VEGESLCRVPRARGCHCPILGFVAASSRHPQCCRAPGAPGTTGGSCHDPESSATPCPRPAAGCLLRLSPRPSPDTGTAPAPSLRAVPRTWAQNPPGKRRQEAGAVPVPVPVPCASRGEGGCRVERSSSVSARPVPSLHQPETMTMTVVEVKR